jgi:hypothetical protein
MNQRIKASLANFITIWAYGHLLMNLSAKEWGRIYEVSMSLYFIPWILFIGIYLIIMRIKPKTLVQNKTV